MNQNNISLEKVIKGLERHFLEFSGACEKCPYYPNENCTDDMAKDALALLKEREPLKPIIVNGEPECAECLYELRMDADSYCPCCGRKVKWE